MRWLWGGLALVVAFAATAGCIGDDGQPAASEGREGDEPHPAIVAAARPQAAQAGAEVLREGGEDWEGWADTRRGQGGLVLVNETSAHPAGPGRPSRTS